MIYQRVWNYVKPLSNRASMNRTVVQVTENMLITTAVVSAPSRDVAVRNLTAQIFFLKQYYSMYTLYQKKKPPIG